MGRCEQYRHQRCRHAGEQSPCDGRDRAEKQADSESGWFQHNLEQLLFIPVTVRFGFNPSSEAIDGALADPVVSGRQSAWCDAESPLQAQCCR